VDARKWGGVEKRIGQGLFVGSLGSVYGVGPKRRGACGRADILSVVFVAQRKVGRVKYKVVWETIGGFGVKSGFWLFWVARCVDGPKYEVVPSRGWSG